MISKITKHNIELLPLSFVYIENGNVIMNTLSEELIGYTNDEISTVAEWENIFKVDLNKGETIYPSNNEKIEASIIQKNGEIKKIELMFHSTENIDLMLLFPKNDKIYLENSLKDWNKILNAMYDSTSDMIFLISVDDGGGFTYLSVNKTFTNITGLKRKNCIGKKIDEIVNTKHLHELKKAYNEVAVKKEILNTETYFHINNTNMSFDTSLIPIIDKAGKCTYILVIAKNITDWKKREEDLLKIKSIAEESNKLKGALLSNLSHEFRTPLNGILGFSELLENELNTEDQKIMVRSIYKSGKRLLNTLNSILELSELEAGKKEIYVTPIDINQIISDLIEKHKHDAELKGLYLNIDFKTSGLKLRLDELIIKQILNNLIDNAIKFTKKGGVNLTVEEVHEKDKKFALIKVIDTGIGISKNHIESIFKEFRQESEGMSRSHEGTGLGLTIAKKMTMLMGGEIFVESEKHKGSTFFLKFAALNTQAENINIDLNPLGVVKPKRELTKLPSALLVEDNFLNSKLTSAFLHNVCSIDSVQDAESALHSLKEKNYDLILMDINLGEGMNGVDIAKVIRTMNEYLYTPIIAMTGYALSKDKETLLSCGFTHYIAKPFEKNQLIELINEALAIEIQ